MHSLKAVRFAGARPTARPARPSRDQDPGRRSHPPLVAAPRTAPGGRLRGSPGDLGQEQHVHGRDPEGEFLAVATSPDPRTPRGPRPRPRSPDDVGQDEQLHGPVHEPHFTAADEHDARRVVLEQERGQPHAPARHGPLPPCRPAPRSAPGGPARRLLRAPGSSAQAAGGPRRRYSCGRARKEAALSLGAGARRRRRSPRVREAFPGGVGPVRRE